MFKKLFKSLTKTREVLVDSIQKFIGISKKIDDEFLKNLERSLFLSDIGVKMTAEIIEKLKADSKNENIENEIDLKNIVFKTINSVFLNVVNLQNQTNHKVNPKLKIILVVGVNGVGKTTTIGKLANKYSNEKLKVIIGSGDTFRAAANEQLNIWAERAKVKIIQQNQGADPASVAFETVAFAKQNNFDVCIIDTAGRLHTKSNLMEELKKIKKVISKLDETAPHEILFVLDATNGQNGLLQANEFNNSVPLTGIILTKLDGTAKGGIAMSILNDLKIPIKFIGVGEGIDDLEEFNPNEFINSILPN